MRPVASPHGRCGNAQEEFRSVTPGGDGRFTHRVRGPKVQLGGITRLLSAGAGASAGSSA